MIKIYRPKDDIVTFYYNSCYCDKDRLSEVENDRSYDIYAEFISNQVMELEEYNTLCDEFKEFLGSYKSGDIMEVIESLNAILKDVPQKRLRATISGKTDDIYKELNQIFAKVFKLQKLEKDKNPFITRYQN